MISLKAHVVGLQRGSKLDWKAAEGVASGL